MSISNNNASNAQLPIGPDTPWLAPLAGFSDLPFRLLCREMGAAAACTEMISAKGLMYESPGTKQLLHTCAQDRPLVVQLFGSDPEVIAAAVSRLMAAGFSWFDLNAGCPVRKVVKTGAGAALLRDPQHLFKILARMADIAGPGRVGVKLRSGWRRGQEVLEWGRELDALGLGWVSLHPRTAAQGYAGRADREVLDALSVRLSLPVVASGDLFTARDGADCVQTTRASGVMFARGALADPGVFAAFLQKLSGREVSAGYSGSGRCRALHLARRHIDLTKKYGSEASGLLKMRTIIPRYLRGFFGVKHVRQRVVACRTWQELTSYLDEVEQRYEK